MLSWTENSPKTSRSNSQSTNVNTNNSHPFFTPLLREIDHAIDLLKRQFPQQSVKQAGDNPDLFKTNELSEYLLGIKQSAANAYHYKLKPPFNFEKLISIVRTTRLNSEIYSKEIITCIINIYTQIYEDIKMPTEQHGGNFSYTDIDEASASNLIKDLLTYDEKTPAGEMLWRICLGLNPDQAAQLIKNHADLLQKMQQLVSFKYYDPFAKHNLSAMMIVRDYPVYYGFFTVKQLISFICTLAEVDSGILNIQGHIQPKTPPKNAIEEQRNKYRYILMSIILKPENTLYLKRVINEAVVDKDFIFAIGIHAEMLPLLDPHIVISCFQAVDQWFYLRASALDILKDTHDHIELKWLFARIIEDMSKGDDRCLRELQQQPYLLYEFISRNLLGSPETLNVHFPQLISLFRAFSHEIILLTLQLVDPFDKEHQTFSMNAAEYPIDKSSDNLREQRSIKLPFKRLTNLLLVDELAVLRREWVQNAKANKLFLEYPFLLCDCNYFEVRKFVLDNRNYRFKTIQCINNDVNPYVYCPFLLAFLPPEEIITLNNNNPKIRWIFDSKQQLPADVVIHYIITGSFAKIAKNIIALEEYLNEQVVELFQEADQRLLTEKLLLKMLQDAKMQQLLKCNPLVLSRFPIQIVQELNKEYPFLLELLDQLASESAEQSDHDHLAENNNLQKDTAENVPVDTKLNQLEFSVQAVNNNTVSAAASADIQGVVRDGVQLLESQQELIEDEQRRNEAVRKQLEIEQVRQKELLEQEQKQIEQRRIEELRSREQQEDEQKRAAELQQQLLESRTLMEKIEKERKKQEEDLKEDMRQYLARQKKKDEEKRRSGSVGNSSPTKQSASNAVNKLRQTPAEAQATVTINPEVDVTLQQQLDEAVPPNSERNVSDVMHNKLAEELALKKKRAEEERLREFESEQKKMTEALARYHVQVVPKQSLSVDQRQNEAIEEERKKHEAEDKKKLDEEARRRQDDDRKRNELAKAAQEKLAEERRQAALLDEVLRNKSKGEGKNDNSANTLGRQAKDKFKAQEEQKQKQEAERIEGIKRRMEEKEQKKKLQEEAAKQSTGNNQQQINSDPHAADVVSELQGVGEKLAANGVFSSASPAASSSSSKTGDDTNSRIAVTGTTLINKTSGK